MTVAVTTSTLNVGAHYYVVSGAIPVHRRQAGGASGAWSLVDANGNAASISTGSDGQGSANGALQAGYGPAATAYFADATASVAELDAVIAAFNGATATPAPVSGL